jgi:NMD protein affecting ribosome stability and mRNA decay
MSDPTASARRDKLIGDTRHDPYREPKKPVDLTGCTECGACFREGRWTWRKAPAAAPRGLCPACRRIRDDYPGGYLAVEGDFVRQHADEIRGLVHNVEEREKSQHPLHRVMAVTDDGEGLLVTTTDAHLAHAIGKALHHAYQGELDAKYSQGESLVRATWRRDSGDPS